MKPKGILLLIGGAEDTGDNEFLDDAPYSRHFKRYEILKKILKYSKNKKIEIITSASEIPTIVRRLYKESFHKIHYPNPGFISIHQKNEADSLDHLKRVKEASAIFFTGGDQRRLVRILRGTELIKIIKHKYIHEKDFLIAGTSAGAMALSTVMIAGGGTREALYHNDLKISRGLDILYDCIVDTHFIKRGRFSRLAHAVALYPKRLGLGLGEDTALLIKHGTDAECRGSGMVIVIDGKYISHSNIRSVRNSDPIYVDNLRAHLLIRGCRFSLTKRKLCKPKAAPLRKELKIKGKVNRNVIQKNRLIRRSTREKTHG